MTLTEFSTNLRKSLPFLILSFLIILILFYSIRLLFIFIELQRPPKVQTNEIFGKIKRPYIKDAPTTSGLHFSLDNIEGRPVTATASARVFFLPPAASRFGYREKVFLMAKTIGFDTESAKYQLLGKQAFFSDSTQKLNIDITNFNFAYEFFFKDKPDIFSSALSPTTKDAEGAAINFLQRLDRYPDELTQGETHTLFFSYDVEKKVLTAEQKNFEANVAEVDLYRPQIDGFQAISPKYPNYHNYVLLAFTPEGYQVLKAQMSFFEKSDSQVGIYTLKTGEQAYTALKEGKGHVITNPQSEKNIVIKKMFLAYFDPNIYQEYLQPVYVFVSEKGFAALVPAVSDSYLAD